MKRLTVLSAICWILGASHAQVPTMPPDPPDDVSQVNGVEDVSHGVFAIWSFLPSFNQNTNVFLTLRSTRLSFARVLEESSAVPATRQYYFFNTPVTDDLTYDIWLKTEWSYSVGVRNFSIVNSSSNKPISLAPILIATPPWDIIPQSMPPGSASTSTATSFESVVTQGPSLTNTTAPDGTSTTTSLESVVKQGPSLTSTTAPGGTSTTFSSEGVTTQGPSPTNTTATATASASGTATSFSQVDDLYHINEKLQTIIIGTVSGFSVFVFIVIVAWCIHRRKTRRSAARPPSPVELPAMRDPASVQGTDVAELDSRSRVELPA
ncbi:unnamed protein product [Penicillium bialowiezense]